jgi:hypothetical protein
MQLVRKYEAGVKKKHGVGKEIFYVEGHWSSVWFYSSLLKWVLGPHVIGFPSIILGLANIFL